LKEYQIFWDDLTPEAQERLKELNHDNIDNLPIAIVDIEDLDEDDFELEEA